MRHVYGPRAISALVPALVRPAFRKRSPAAAQVMADWDQIVGPAIAAVSQPRKLFSGTLAIACTGPMAMELQHLSTELIARINTYLGQVTVTRLRFIQDLQTPPLRKLPPKRAIEAAHKATETIADPELRAALEKLGQYVLSPRPR
jgi:hypothetical protein